jgi:hypothetical protein
MNIPKEKINLEIIINDKIFDNKKEIGNLEVLFSKIENDN